MKLYRNYSESTPRIQKLIDVMRYAGADLNEWVEIFDMDGAAICMIGESWFCVYFVSEDDDCAVRDFGQRRPCDALVFLDAPLDNG